MLIYVLVRNELRRYSFPEYQPPPAITRSKLTIETPE